MRRDPAEMTIAELRRLRESLGLTVRALAAAIGVDRRTVTRWEAGEALSEGSASALRRLVEYTNRSVDKLAETHGPGDRIVTYPTDKAYREAGGQLPSAWHRMVADRAAERCGARIDYP